MELSVSTARIKAVVWFLPIQLQNWIQQMACIRFGRCRVVLRMCATIRTAPDLASESLRNRQLKEGEASLIAHLVEIKTRSSTA